MIDLHCHILPGIDDGAPNRATSLEMARIAVQDGIWTVACTPHIYPGLYENDSDGIESRVEALRGHLERERIPLRLVVGADAHLGPDLLLRLTRRTAPTLNGSRYFLLDPPHHAAPPRFPETAFQFLLGGFVPVVTHPERLTWIEEHYKVFQSLARGGVWMQVTSGSLTGRFGSEARYWGERLLDDGLVHILATDAHGAEFRLPLLAEGVRVAEQWVGAEEAHRMVHERPQAILDNAAPGNVAPILALTSNPRVPPGRPIRRFLRHLYR